MNTQIKLILMLAALFCTTVLKGSPTEIMQRENIERIMERYSQSKYAESVDISPTLLKQLSGAKNTDKLLNGVSGFRLLVLSKQGSEALKLAGLLEKEAKEALQKEYSRLMSIHSGGDRVSLYIEEASKQMVMLIDAENDLTLMIIDGSITQELIKAVMDGDIKIK